MTTEELKRKVRFRRTPDSCITCGYWEEKGQKDWQCLFLKTETFPTDTCDNHTTTTDFDQNFKLGTI